MSLEIGILPSGHLHCFSSATDGDSGESVRDAPVDKAFARHAGEGLFALAAGKDSADMPPSFIYWRNFACKYLSARCLLAPTDPIQPDPMEPLTAADTASLLLGVPPMRGAEYLSAQALENIWTLLDIWVREQIRAHGGLAAFLEGKAPRWHEVGRVCFHLAENKNDSDRPFAFMATYAPELSGQGRVRHQPLHRAFDRHFLISFVINDKLGFVSQKPRFFARLPGNLSGRLYWYIN